MTTEPMVLRCTCGVEVRLVRLNPETLTFGHVRNPRQNRHAVRLARSATASPLGRADGSLSEGPDMQRKEAANADASQASQPSAQRGSTSGGAPRVLTPRAAQSAEGAQ